MISAMNAAPNPPVFIRNVKLECDSNCDDDDNSTLQDFITKAKRRRSENVGLDSRPFNTISSSFLNEWKLNGDLSHVEIFDLESENEICVVLDCTEESSVAALRNSVDHLLLSQDFPHEITEHVNMPEQEYKNYLIVQDKFTDVDISYDEEEVRVCSGESSQTVGRNLRKKRVEVSNVQKILAVKRELKSDDDKDGDDDDDDWTLDRWKQRLGSSICKRKSTHLLADSPSMLGQQSMLDKVTKTNEAEELSDKTERTMTYNVPHLKKLSAVNGSRGGIQNFSDSFLTSGYKIENYYPVSSLLLRSQSSDILGDTEAFSVSTDELAFEEDQFHMTDIDHNKDIISAEEFYVNFSSIHNMPILRDEEDTMQYIMLTCLAASDTSRLGGSLLEAGASIKIRSSQEKDAKHVSENSNGLLIQDDRASIHCSSENPQEFCPNTIHKSSKNVSNMEANFECSLNHSLTVSEVQCQASDGAIAATGSDADSFQIELSPNFNRLISQGNSPIQKDQLSSRCRIPITKNSSCLSSYPSKQESVKGVTLGGSVSKLPSKRKVKFDSLEDPGQTKVGDSAQASDSCKNSLDLNGFSHFRDDTMRTKKADSQSIVSENVRQPKSPDFSQLPTASFQLLAQDDQSAQTSNLALHSPCHLNHAHRSGSPLSQEQSPDPSTKFSLVLTSSPSPPHPASFKGSPDSPVKSSFLEKSEDTRPIRGILKQSLQHTVCNCVECQSVRSRAERAAKFSQQQLHDIQGLTGILMKELRSMRNMVEENLVQKRFSESQLEQVKSATSRAIESEAVAKKWLVKMVRDCNRYCKLQETQKRKITFADEAGKQLCHVKHYQKNNNFNEHSRTLHLHTAFS